jgi:hypothetical protein
MGFEHTDSEKTDAEETTAAAADLFGSAGEEPFYAQVGFTEVHHTFDQRRTVDYPVDVQPQTFADHEERMATTGNPRPFAQLYDVEAGPYELDDLGSDSEYEGAVTELSRRLLRWMVSVDGPLLQGRVRLPYYEMAVEDLLTRSLEPGTRSSRSGNRP